MNPNEIFSFPVESKTDQSREAVERHYCRFLGKSCDKQSRTIDYPMGVCSVNHSKTKPIICPHRFLEDNLVFINACNSAFGETNNVLLFSEVKINNVGTFDFVLVKHRPMSSKVDDFCVVEFQSDSTTGTGKLVSALRDFMGGIDVLQRKYRFGMNTYNTIKLSYIQMLIKGQVLEKWNKRIYWVMQKYVYENMVKRFHLTNMEHDIEHSTQYHIYDLFSDGEIYSLQLTDMRSTTISNLLRAFTHQPTPSLDDFIVNLEKRIRLKLGLTIEQ